MEELRKLLHETADDAIELTQYTLNELPDTCLSECFPYTAYRTIEIDGFPYQVSYEVKLRPIG